jgi:CubicO group peptidase (beta-lactamase class C family)
MRHWLTTLAIVSIAAAQFSATETRSAVEPDAGCGTPTDLQDGWSVAPPQQQGLDPAMLCAMGSGVADGKLAEVDSIVVVRHGVLVYEGYFNRPNRARLAFDATTKHEGHSMTKSVTSLLVGIAVDRGLIKDLDAPVLSFFPEYADLATPEKNRITLRHLLTMSAGWGGDDAKPPRAMPLASPYRTMLERQVEMEPGSTFKYDSDSTELLAAVLQKVTGKTLDILAKEELFEPLGIVDVAWQRHLPNGSPMASTALVARPRDWAKLGQLVLDRGAWHGKQIVSSSWIDLSTSMQKSATTAPDGSASRLAYGFQWWLGRSSNDGRVVDWTAAMGFNSQKTIIAPSLDLVVVFNASRQSKRMVAPEIELLDQHILPAIANP